MALVAAAVLAGALVQSATGLGFALVAGPVLVAALAPEEALLTLAALGVVLSGLVLAEGGHVAWPVLRPVLLAALPGTVAGVLVLRALPPEGVQAAVGVAVLGAVALRLRRRPLDAPPAVMGVVTGALTTSVGVNGPPLALWLQARGLDGAALRATLAAAFVALAAAGVAVLIPAGAAVDPVTLAVGAVAVVAGHGLGRLAFARLDAAAHERALLAVIAVAGAVSVAAAVVGG